MEFNFEKYGIGKQELQDEVKLLAEQAQKSNEAKGLFKVKTANDWIMGAKTRPTPKMLFGEFWYEGELCILFADTNLGKSILAVQVGDSISRGAAIGPFKFEAQKQSILYFDFELSDKQFEIRYSIENQVERRHEDHYKWSDNFLRVEIDPEAAMPGDKAFEDFLNESLERSIIETGAKILIIDNLTYLKNETEKAKDALPLMKHLKALKSKHGLSILALAHTPKRDLTKPLTKNDLQGSKMLINFCDSSFAIGENHTDTNLRYLKQIKQRNTEQIYDSENVCTCLIHKPHNFLQFEFSRYGSEAEHLKQPTEKDKEGLIQKVLEFKDSGKSSRIIGKELGISHMTVERIYKKHKA